MSGHLHWFIGVPPQREPPTSERVNADWSIPFHAAGLDLKNFQPVTSTRVPLHAYDERTAWDGIDAAHPNDKLHVEAAAFRGKLVYFETIYPWDRFGRQEQPGESRSSKVLTYMLIVISLFALFGSALLARRNLRLGRGDRRGAMRLAIVFFVVRMLFWAFACASQRPRRSRVCADLVSPCFCRFPLQFFCGYSTSRWNRLLERNGRLG